MPVTTEILPVALKQALRQVRTAGVITGAGISAESGIPTYRGTGGVYEDPAEGRRTVEALSGRTLARDPDRTWRAVVALARHAVDARPNAAHLALVRMETLLERFTILTQNVDGLHRQAGSRNVIDIHGDVLATRCLDCPAHGRLTREAVVLLAAAPRCAACGGRLRPDAVLFEETLPPAKVMRLQEAFYVHPPDLVLAIGTSAVFPYIAGPVLDAARDGRLTVEVNPEPTALSPVVSYSLRGPAGRWVPLISEALAAV
jgi:NAD-dependent deacetylase